MDFLTNLSTLAPIGAVIVFGWGVYQFYRATEIAFRKPYWEKQITLYLEATSTAATLASTDDEHEWDQARNTFWRLYHGPLCLVEDRAVEAAMIDFGMALDEAQIDFGNRSGLSELSLNLAIACRNSIRSDWKVPLEDLRVKPVVAN